MPVFHRQLTAPLLALLLMASLMAPVAPLHAAVYKWVDENGQVHYGERPDKAARAEKLNLPELPATEPRISKEAIEIDRLNREEARARAREQAARQPKPVKPKIPPAEKRRLCRQARGDLQTILSRGRMREINNKGEYIYLSEEQRQQRIRATRQRIKRYCH